MALIEFPSVTIVIPTFARPKQLKNCLNAIAALEYPASRFEVLVVDDGSDCGVQDIVRPFKGQCNIEYSAQPHLGPAAARNHGARIASGEILAFTDDDCRPDSLWLMAISGNIAMNKGALLGGKIVNSLNDNLYSRASQLLIDY